MLALAHERGCEADLAAALAEQLADGGVPDLASLRARFVPTATRLPAVTVDPLGHQLRRAAARDGSDSIRDNGSRRVGIRHRRYCAPAAADG